MITANNSTALNCSLSKVKQNKKVQITKPVIITCELILFMSYYTKHSSHVKVNEVNKSFMSLCRSHEKLSKDSYRRHGREVNKSFWLPLPVLSPYIFTLFRKSQWSHDGRGHPRILISGLDTFRFITVLKQNVLNWLWYKCKANRDAQRQLCSQRRTGGKKWPGSYCQTGPLNTRRAAHDTRRVAHSMHHTYRQLHLYVLVPMTCSHSQKQLCLLASDANVE